MKKKFDFDMEGLAQGYAVANTPMFWFKQLYNNQSVQYWAQKADVPVLQKEFLQWVASPLEGIEELVYVYALYMVLLMQEEASRFFLENEGKIYFEWFPDLVSIYHTYYPSTVYEDIKMSSPTTSTFVIL